MARHDEEKKTILRLLEEGKISSDEALKLLNAIGEGEPPLPAAPGTGESGSDGDGFHGRTEEARHRAREAAENLRREFSDRFGGVARAAREFFGELVQDLGAVAREIPESGIFRAGETESIGKALLDDEVGDATLLSIDGPIDFLKLRPSDSGRVEAEAELFVDPAADEMAKRSVRLLLDRDGARLRLRVDAPHGVRTRAEVVARVPAGLAVSARTGAGRLDAECLDGDLAVEAKIGTLEVANHRGRVDLRTKGGSIKASGIEGDLSVESVTGSVRVAGVSGKATIECRNGAVEVERVAGRLVASGRNGVLKATFPETLGEGPHELETKNGTVTLLFPAGAGAVVEASTRLGRVVVLPGIECAERDGRRVVGAGGPLVTASTSLGSVTIGPASEVKE